MDAFHEALIQYHDLFHKECIPFLQQLKLFLYNFLLGETKCKHLCPLLSQFLTIKMIKGRLQQVHAFITLNITKQFK